MWEVSASACVYLYICIWFIYDCVVYDTEQDSLVLMYIAQEITVQVLIYMYIMIIVGVAM